MACMGDDPCPGCGMYPFEGEDGRITLSGNPDPHKPDCPYEEMRARWQATTDEIEKARLLKALQDLPFWQGK